MEKLHHIALPVNDIDESVAWYRKNFDVEPVQTDESWALLKFENVALALVLPDQHPAHIAVERVDAEQFGPLTPHRDGTRSTYI
ncbi:MAG: VOC family protein, partial [Rhodospirillaceae bacterium]|nr:VOC family protein [Rhodospirillaceae bacterium]